MVVWSSEGSESHACNCIGPQNGQPLCPCQMRSVAIVDGRYVRTEDLGPVKRSVEHVVTTCRTCQGMIGTRDAFCSHCGAKQDANPERRRGGA